MDGLIDWPLNMKTDCLVIPLILFVFHAVWGWMVMVTGHTHPFKVIVSLPVGFQIVFVAGIHRQYIGRCLITIRYELMTSNELIMSRFRWTREVKKLICIGIHRRELVNVGESK